MNKNRVIRLLILCIILVGVICGYICSKTVTFYYFNPQTETSGMKYIAKTIYKLNYILERAKNIASSSEYKYKYIYTNAYGSGFLKNNPIPNDLDYDVFIDLGTFDYRNGKTKNEIADEIVKKMDFFQEAFMFTLNQSKHNEFLTYRTQTGQYKQSQNRHELYVSEIADSLDDALSQKEYINHLTKTVKDTGKVIYYMPYVMNEGKIIIKDYDLLMFYNDEITYNERMPKYLRELSIGLTFTAKVKQDDKVVTLEFVPELFSTGPLGLTDRLFAPNVFFKHSAVKYLKNMPELADNEHFIDSLLYCAFDHLLVIDPEDAFEYNPLKALKRIVEVSDMFEPVLDPNERGKALDAIVNAWNNRDIQLLNEYNNIVTNITKIYIRPLPYSQAKGSGKLKVMISTLENVLAEMEERKNINPDYIKVFKDFRNNEINAMLNEKTYLDLKTLEKSSYNKKYRRTVAPVLSKAVLEQIKDKNIIQKHIDNLKHIFYDSGYKYIRIYIAGLDTIELEDNEFTRSIKDFKDFAKKNNLATDMNFKLVEKEKIPREHIRYNIWVRYNTTPEQDAYFENLKQKLLDTKSRYKIKSKSYLVW